MKIMIVAMFFLYMGISVYADNTLKNALFAKIVHVKSNDTLNVRAYPDYRSAKIAELNSDMVVGLSGKCKKSGKSTWCQVYELAAYGGDKEGWGNAYYLKPYSEGFVTVKGYDKNCYYALECAYKEGKNQCLVVLNKDNEATWMERSLLRGESQFGAASHDMDGYCIKGAWLDKYVRRNKQHSTATDQTEIKNVIHKLLEALEQKNPAKQIAELIHPEQGVTVTEMVRFGSKDDKHFSRISFLDTMHKKKRLFWGYTYGKGNEIYKTLPAYFDDLHKERNKITKIKPLESLKSFPAKADKKLKGLEVYWINEASETKEYDYLGMVVILSQYHGKWYIVGLLRDRWTI